MSTGHKNLANSLVATPPSPQLSGTSLVVTSGEGSRFPTVPFWATLWLSTEFPTLDNSEIVRVTGRSSDTLTVERAKGGTTAKAITTAYRLANTVMAEDMPTALDPRRFGAEGDGTTDDTAAVQAWINAGAVYGSENALILPKGRYVLTSTITVPQCNGLLIQGSGGPDLNSGGSTFFWRGDAASPAFYMPDPRQYDFRNFAIQCGPSGSGFNPLLVGFEMENVSGGVAPTRNSFHNVIVVSTTTGGILKAGWLHDLGSGGDANNDQTYWDHCEVLNYDNCAWLTKHSQSLGHFFLHCTAFGAAAGGQIGVSMGNDTHAGAIGAGGSFHWFGGYMSRNEVADFYLGAPVAESFTIFGMVSERSARLFDMQGNTGGWGGGVIIGTRFAHAGELHADGKVIRFRGPGPWRVQDCNFEDAVGWGGPHALQIHYTPFSDTIPGYGQLIVEGNVIGMPGGASAPVLVEPVGAAAPRITLSNNAQYDGATGASGQYQDFGKGTYVAAVKTANYTTKHYLDEIVPFDTTSGVLVCTLATAVGWAGKKYTIVKVLGGNTLTIDPTGSETVGGAATLAVTTAVTVVSDDANWLVVG